MDDRFSPDQVFEHEYDGIQEYDNPLPRWWVTLWALSIIFCFPYLLYYHVGAGPSIIDNLDAENAAFAARLLETYGELKIDEGTILTFCPSLHALAGGATAAMHPDDISSSNLLSGSDVTLSNDIGSITLPMVADSGVAAGCIAVEFNQPNASVAQLLDARRIVTSVRVESAS